MANVTTSAETNVLKKANVSTVREKDMALRFADGIKKFLEILGVTRQERKEAGTTLYTLKAVGTLESGDVAEGEIIPLSQIETVKEPVGEIELKKWRRATTAESILKGGYDQSVTKTNNKLISLIQNFIKNNLIGFLADGTGVASGTTFQAALAQAWGQLQVKFEDTDIEDVFFMNPLDVADYLATANIGLAQAFGMSYVENFLGLGTVFFNAAVPRNHIYATAKENLIMVYVGANDADLSEAFDFTTDDTGLIGVHEAADYDRLQSETVAFTGVLIMAERLDGVIVSHIDASPTLGSLTVTSEAGTAVGDTKITITETKAAGNLYKYKVADAATEVTYGMNVRNWNSWDGTSDITAATGKVITVVECDAQYHADKEGHATVTAKAAG